MDTSLREFLLTFLENTSKDIRENLTEVPEQIPTKTSRGITDKNVWNKTLLEKILQIFVV